MEHTYTVHVWMGIVMGWRQREMVIHADSYVIRKIKNKKFFQNANAKTTTFFLQNARVYDVPLNSKSKRTDESHYEFIIQTYEVKNFIRASSKENKIAIINKLNEVIQNVNSKSAFSNDYQNYRNAILKQFDTVDPFNSVTLRLTHFQNLFLEFNQKLETLKTLITEKNIKYKQNEFVTVHCNMVIIKDEMKKQFDEIISTIYDYHECKGNDGFEMEGTTTTNIKDIQAKQEEQQPTQSSSSSSQNENLNEDNNNIISDDESSRSISNNNNNQQQISCSMFSSDVNDFINKTYSFEPRTQFTKSFGCGNNLVKEFFKSMTTRKGSLPIYFNEPITMLQKQCERFYYMDLLTKANEEEDPKMQMCYISAFIIGEIFLNLGRVLKPFNPILGETYEYYDNSKQFRFFSEQVSHNPPISAFIGETPAFAMFGDSRASTSFKLLKGCLEVSFNNKTHLLLKKHNRYFVFNKPLILMKGLVKAPVHNDYGGDVTIQCIECPDVKCVLTFIDESKKPIGTFEGKVYDGEKVVYEIGGNWNNEVYYTDNEGNNKVTLLNVDANEKYITNTENCYTLPTFSYVLNQTTEELSNTLPKCDSRMRPDLREYEEGDNTKAQEIKLKIEMKQRLRHQKFEEDKVQYTPYYFVNEYNEKSDDYVYLFNGKYWYDKANGNVKELKDSDIFDITGIVI